MEDLVVREATLADKDAVLSVHDNVFEGSDYLPVYYEHFIASPDITPFVILHEDKIVSIYQAEAQCNTSLVVRKTVFVVSDQVRHKPGCTVTEDG